MVHSQHKNRSKKFPSNKHFVLFGLATMAIIFMATTGWANAATLYNFNETAACLHGVDASKGNYRLDPPHEYEGVEYYCIQNLTLAQIKPPNGANNCAAGVGRIHNAFAGFGCLDLDNPVVKKPATIPTGDSSWFSDTCGALDNPDQPPIKVAIGLGCRNKGNPIMDATFGIIRFLSYGVGLVIIASTVVAGIQYSASRGDPNATAKAIARVRNNIIALIVFVFAFAIINWLVPAGILH